MTTITGFDLIATLLFKFTINNGWNSKGNGLDFMGFTTFFPFQIAITHLIRELKIFDTTDPAKWLAQFLHTFKEIQRCTQLTIYEQATVQLLDDKST